MTLKHKPSLVLMMNKRIAISPAFPNSTADFYRDRYYPMLSKWFDLEFYTNTKQYPANTVFMHEAYYPPSGQLARQHLEQGHRVIFHNVTERVTNPSPLEPALAWSLMYPDQTFWLISGNDLGFYPTVRYSEISFWFWLYEQFVDDYRDYQPNPRPDKLFMLLMNRSRHHRTYLWHELQHRPHLMQQGIASYRGHDIFIADEPPSPLENRWHDRTLNPDWFDRSAVSLISETDVERAPRQSVWLTEKTTKALMMQHPFLLQAQPGSLEYLHAHGFETFPELWDESYDQIPHYYSRTRRLLNILETFDPGSIGQAQVQEKLRHNHARFWDREVTKKLFVEQIINPLLEWINA